MNEITANSRARIGTQDGRGRGGAFALEQLIAMLDLHLDAVLEVLDGVPTLERSTDIARVGR
jgi:hypothetical protein